MLTHRQREALDWICGYLSDHGESPTVREICGGINLASAGSVHRLVGQLELRGFIRRTPDKARGIEIVENRDRAFFVWSDEIQELVPWEKREERAQ